MNLRGDTHQQVSAALLVHSKLAIFFLELTIIESHMSSDKKLRIFIIVALLVGWIVVVFLRSGTSWG